MGRARRPPRAAPTSPRPVRQRPRPLSREQAESPTQLNVKERREREAAIHREVAAEVSRIVWEARDLARRVALSRGRDGARTQDGD